MYFKLSILFNVSREKWVVIVNSPETNETQYYERLIDGCRTVSEYLKQMNFPMSVSNIKLIFDNVKNANDKIYTIVVSESI